MGSLSSSRDPSGVAASFLACCRGSGAMSTFRRCGAPETGCCGTGSLRHSFISRLSCQDLSLGPFVQGACVRSEPLAAVLFRHARALWCFSFGTLVFLRWLGLCLVVLLSFIFSGGSRHRARARPSFLSCQRAHRRFCVGWWFLLSSEDHARERCVKDLSPVCRLKRNSRLPLPQSKSVQPWSSLSPSKQLQKRDSACPPVLVHPRLCLRSRSLSSQTAGAGFPVSLSTVCAESIQMLVSRHVHHTVRKT